MPNNIARQVLGVRVGETDTKEYIPPVSKGDLIRYDDALPPISPVQIGLHNGIITNAQLNTTSGSIPLGSISVFFVKYKIYNYDGTFPSNITMDIVLNTGSATSIGILPNFSGFGGTNPVFTVTPGAGVNNNDYGPSGAFLNWTSGGGVTSSMYMEYWIYYL